MDGASPIAIIISSWGRARFVRRERTIISGVNIEGSIVVAVRVPGAREFGASGGDGRDLKSWKRARAFASVEREARRGEETRGRERTNSSGCRSRGANGDVVDESMRGRVLHACADAVAVEMYII